MCRCGISQFATGAELGGSRHGSSSSTLATVDNSQARLALSAHFGEQFVSPRGEPMEQPRFYVVL